MVQVAVKELMYKLLDHAPDDKVILDTNEITFVHEEETLRSRKKPIDLDNGMNNLLHSDDGFLDEDEFNYRVS